MKLLEKYELQDCRTLVSPYRGENSLRDVEHAMVDCIDTLGLDWLEAGEYCIEQLGANRNAMNHWANTYSGTSGLNYY